ncbi:acid-sensing system DNA-binding response regulator EvgA [Klebsiella pneumoniae]|uniref:acid-sensing system DNA-binding response regulator EvgA n=1 Tax=Klebsiella pneumoniae TaxID=573 RepID=UPI000C7B5CF4|nr:acid-sensing system DNA-binding response regulator EvgA [Klebsiella pneumoniae]MDP1326813.1 acid-sensing system DNA-binding response regulator EvgA [Klebsiella pneumoniae]MDP1349421.1 acid-sensing system DNA-binding response regulator EvgA [Klebsiella pneumoniae]MDP1409420.1 acid-sensing system DNA-binding response regulator EvgA [Klebsiella pneumoniae]PLJ25402.1 DNA-binding response regulator [Klebsiella pneumoniae]HDZ0429760.1 acid-sensing system DNA-binding response regulator EvgA [Klebs
MSKTANLSAIIIDDHPLARMAIRNLLENEGFNIVAEAGDGGEALMAVAEYQPDVVIVDVDIPVMSGIEVVEKLRKKQFSHIIIVVSAKNDLFYGKRSADAGANAFISKKEWINNIISAIHAAQNGYSYFPFSLSGFVGSLSNEQAMLQSLSSQEVKVMRAILNGADNMQIASEMHISNKTVSTYKGRLMEKLGCKSLVDLFSFANRNKIG